ncbi:MAG: hypothetical protein IT242_08665 [Bacteroidia bacterium]|nr:hypothetical protein [Bacteroidia bacterium]
MKDTVLYSFTQRPKFFLNLTSYNSYISGSFVNFTGLRLGLNYNRRVRFGIGFYSLDRNSYISRISVVDGKNSYTTNGELKFDFISVSTEYTYFIRYPWQFSILPLQLGVGQANYQYIRRSDTSRVNTPLETVIIYHPDLYAQFNIFKWLGLGATVGGRVTLYASQNVREDFNSYTYSLAVKVFLEELYHALFHPVKNDEGSDTSHEGEGN